MRTLIIGTTMAVLLFPYIAFSQINCFTYAGGVISCDSKQGNILVAPLGSGQTIIRQTERYQPPASAPPATRQENRHSSVFDEAMKSRPSEPRALTYEEKYGPSPSHDAEDAEIMRDIRDSKEDQRRGGQAERRQRERRNGRECRSRNNRRSCCACTGARRH
jgi:hypothetical protein